VDFSIFNVGGGLFCKDLLNKLNIPMPRPMQIIMNRIFLNPKVGELLLALDCELRFSTEHCSCA